MPSSPASRAALVVTNATREYNCDSAVNMNQNKPVTHTQGQISGTELTLMEKEMTEVEYTQMTEVDHSYFQHVILEYPDLIVDASPGPGGSATQTLTTPGSVDSTLTSSSLTTQAIDLTISTDLHTAVRSPSICGDVLWSVLDKIRADVESPADGSASLFPRPCSAVRACLEKRFYGMPAAADIPTQQDAQSAALTKFRSIIQQSTEGQDAFINPLMQRWIRSDSESPMELSIPYGGSMLNTFTGTHRQVLGNLDPNKRQGPVTPDKLTKPQCNTRTIPAGGQQQMKTQCVAVAEPAAFVKHAKKRNATQDSEKWMAGLLSTNKACKENSLGVRERHNMLERARRKKISQCCDELNSLVPFCDSDSDKATTLHWTTAFLRYINESHGDIKQEFQNKVRKV